MGRTDYFEDPNAPRATVLKPAVSAFVQDDQGRILMIRRTDNDRYAIPGGQQEPGETLTETAVREVQEETGIDIEVTNLIGLYSNPRHIIAYDDGEARQEFSICFRATYTGGQIRTSSESKEVRWVTVSELSGLNIHPSIRLRLTHALERRHEPYYT